MARRALPSRRDPEVRALLASLEGWMGSRVWLILRGAQERAPQDDGASRPRRSPSLDRTAPRRAGHAWMDPARGLKARFCHGLRAARQLGQHAQRLDHPALAHRAAADGAEAAFAMQNSAVAGGDGKMRQADRLARSRSARTGDAG